jgi:hypothetical protein
MNLRRIVRKTTKDDSTGEVRSVFIWEDTQEEIHQGLYQASIKKTLLNKEVLIWKNQEKGEIHDMFIAGKLNPLDLQPEKFESGEFSFIRSILGEAGMRSLEERLHWDSRKGILKRR